MGIVSRSQGGSGGGVILFDSTLGAPAASIDTGAGGIAAGQNILEVHILARGDVAAAQGTVDITVNNDGGANYDRLTNRVTNVTSAGNQGLAAVAWTLPCHGNAGLAGEASHLWLLFPSYTVTTFNKVATCFSSEPDSVAANNIGDIDFLTWRSTAAITRLKVAAAGGSANLIAGSRLLVLGR